MCFVPDLDTRYFVARGVSTTYQRTGGWGVPEDQHMSSEHAMTVHAGDLWLEHARQLMRCWEWRAYQPEVVLKVTSLDHLSGRALCLASTSAIEGVA